MFDYNTSQQIHQNEEEAYIKNKTKSYQTVEEKSVKFIDDLKRIYKQDLLPIKSTNDEDNITINKIYTNASIIYKDNEKNKEKEVILEKNTSFSDISLYFKNEIKQRKCQRCIRQSVQFLCESCQPLNLFCCSCDEFVHSLISKSDHRRRRVDERNEKEEGDRREIKDENEKEMREEMCDESSREVSRINNKRIETNDELIEVETKIETENDKRNSNSSYNSSNEENPNQIKKKSYSQEYIEELKGIYEKEKENLKMKNDHLLEKTNSLKVLFDSQVLELQNENEQKLRKIKELEEEVSKLNDIISKIDKEKERKTIENEEISVVLSSINMEYDKKINYLIEEFNKEKLYFQSKLDYERKENNELKEINSKIKYDNEGLVKLINEYEYKNQEYNKITNVNGMLKNKLDEYTELIKLYEQESKKIISINEDFSKEIHIKNDKIHKLLDENQYLKQFEEEAERMRKEIKQINKDFSEIERQFEEMSIENEELKEYKSRYEKIVEKNKKDESFKSQYDKQVKEIEKLKYKINILSDENENLKLEVKELISKVRSKEKEKDDVKGRRKNETESKGKEQDLNNNCENIIKENIRLKEELNKMKIFNGKLIVEIEDLNGRFNNN